MEKDPRKRYRTANDLARWQAGEPILARPLGPVGRVARWARRKPSVAALLVLVVLVSAAGAGVGFWQWDDARANARMARAHAENAERERDVADRERAAADHARDVAEGARRKADIERYAVSVRSAGTALRVHDVTTARAALESVPEGAREWAWQAMHAQLDRAELTVPFGRHGHRFGDARGRWVAFGYEDGSVRIWFPDAREAKRVPVPFALARFVVSPDGAVVACVPKGRSDVILCEPHGGRVGATLPGLPEPPSLVQFSGCGTRLIAGTDRQLRVWSVPGGRELLRLDAPPGFHPITASADLGALVVMRFDTGALRVLCTETGRERCAIAPSEFHRMNLVFSPDGERLVVGEGFPSNALHLYDTRTGARLGDLVGHANELKGASFSPDGTKLVTTSYDRTVRVWDATASGPSDGSRQLRRFRGHTHWVTDVVFNAAGTKVVTGGYDGTVRVRDVLTGDALAVLSGHEGGTGPVAFRADGSVVSASADNTVKHWSAHEASGEGALKGHTSFVYDCAFFPDGRTVVSSGWDGTARVWDAGTGREVLPPLKHGKAGAVASVAVSADGRTIATYARNEKNDSACPDNGVYLWDARTGERLHFWPLRGLGWLDSRLAFSPCGTKIATGTSGGPVRVWDVASRKQTHELAAGFAARAVAFSPCGTKLAVGYHYDSAAVRVWDLGTGTVARRFDAVNKPTTALAWSADGARIAIGSWDRTASLWDARTGERVCSSIPHGGDVLGVAFGPDGSLVTACFDGVVRVWNPATGHLTAELIGHTDYVHQVAFSPDGSRLVAASGDRTLRVWDAKKPAERKGK